MKFRYSPVFPAFAAVLSGAAVAGCSSSGGGASMPIVGGLETTHITVYDFPSIDSAGLYIAEQDGLFKKEGLNVAVVPDFKSTQDTVTMIESGKAQVSSGDYVTYMDNELGANPNLEIIAEASVLQPNQLGLMVKPGSDITTVQDLEIADTNRAEVEKVIEGQPLSVAKGIAAVVALPQFPNGIDPTRLQRVVDDMVRFGFFTGKELAEAKAFKVSSMIYDTNIANTNGGSNLLTATS